MNARPHPAWGFVVLAAVACVEAPPTSAPVEVTDSAGIEIVRHRSLDTPELSVDWGAAIRVGDAPVEGIGFFEVVSAVRLPSGGIAVADAGNHRIVYFEDDGTPRSTTGRQGEGPGEFQQMGLASRWRGDSLVVWDHRARRLSVLDPQGTFARSFMLESTEAVPRARVISVYADGSFLATGFADTGPGGIPSGRRGYPSPIYHFGPDGGHLATTGVFMSGESYFEALDNGGFRIYPAVFPRLNVRLAAGELFVLASNETFELRFLRRDGTPVRIVRGPSGVRPVSPELREAEIERLVEDDGGEDPEAFRRTLSAMETPEFVPEFTAAFADAVGRVWVALRDPAAGDDTTEWLVFDGTGTLTGRVALPSGLRLMDAGPDWVVGVETDALDVETVVLAPVAPTASAATLRPR